MQKKQIMLIYWLLAILPLIVTGVLLPFFPDTIPAHWSSGEIDRFSSKFELLILPGTIPVIALFFSAFFRFITKVSDHDNSKSSNVSMIIIMIVFNAIVYILLFTTYRTTS